MVLGARPSNATGCAERSRGCERGARSSLVRRAWRHASAVVAALRALAPGLARLARRHYSDRLLVRRAALVAVIAVGAATAAGVWTYARNAAREELPAAFAARVNPRAHDPTAVAEGATIFQGNCASCHGEHADGHGVAAVGLTPPPANFRGSDVLARHSDPYLFYRITEGKPGTAMPSFRGALAENERWAVIAYLRSLAHDDVARR